MSCVVSTASPETSANTSEVVDVDECRGRFCEFIIAPLGGTKSKRIEGNKAYFKLDYNVKASHQVVENQKLPNKFSFLKV